MPERIPISAAQDIAKTHGCKQVIIAAWDGQKTHIVTYGTSVEMCDQAAQGGNLIKRALGWPESMCNAEPSRIKKLNARIKELETELADARAIGNR